MNLTQQRFYGFLKTPFLWSHKLLELQQFQSTEEVIKIDEKIPDTIRLGNYVERLVSHQLNHDERIQILKENAQIISNKITLGEIDCLLLQDQQPIHLEIAYKFYLYDASVETSFLEHWIGPNRRDSLLLKLNKIKEKQFPLLYSTECKSLLEELSLKVKDIQQQTFFKAQLFVPYSRTIEFPLLSSKCIYGFYINYKEVSNFQECKFYIPKKLDWIIDPHTQVDWMNFTDANKKIEEFYQKKSAPLCWMKHSNGEIVKIFVVWW